MTVHPYAEEGDEVSFHLDDGRERKVLIESVAKAPPASAIRTEEMPIAFQA